MEEYETTCKLCRLQYKSSSTDVRVYLVSFLCVWKTTKKMQVMVMVVFDDDSYDPDVAICNEP